MKPNGPRIAQRKAPHVIAENFKADMRPTLIVHKEEFLAYEDDGAYRLINNKAMMSEAQTYLEGAQEMRPTGMGRTKAFPFNPKTADAKELFGQLERKCEVGNLSPHAFWPANTKSTIRFSSIRSM